MDDGPNNIGFQILIIVCLVLMNGFFALAEMALVSVRRTRIKQLVESGDRRAITVQKLLDKPTSFMSTVQIGVTLVGFLASAFAAVSIAKLPATWLMMLGLSKSNSMQISVFIVTVLVGFFTLVVGEIAPKSLALQHAEKYALKFAGFIRFLSIIAMPAVKIVSFCSDLVVRPFGGHVKFSTPILTQEELKMLVETGEEEGVIELEEREMIHSIFDFTDTVAKEVMVPRTDMHCAPVSVSLDELTDMITLTGHSRIPIYEDNVDNIIGVVHAKDLIPVLSKDKNSFNIKSLMREPYFIPESKDVDELLADLRRDNIQMAIARDEYGGTAGLVTLEDLLEEIVGEIRDEYDVEEPLIQIIDENSFHVNARMRVDELNEQMGLSIPESEDYGTVGGFVFDLFGHQPNQDDCISDGDLTFIAEKMESGRIERIRIVKLSSPDPGQIDSHDENNK